MSSSVRVYYKQASTAVVHMGTKIFLGFQCNNFDTNDSDMTLYNDVSMHCFSAIT